MEKHKAVHFLSGTGLEPLEKHKATDVGSMLLHACLGLLRDSDVGLPCLKYLESFARILDAAFNFVSLRPESHLVAPYR